MVCPLEITTLSVMKHFMILIVLLIIPFTINAQESDTKVGVIMVGLVINNNEFATSLQTRCFELYKCQNQMHLQELAVNNNLNIPKPTSDYAFEQIVGDYFISQTFNSKIDDEILLSKEQSDIIKSLLSLSQINIKSNVSTAPDFVFILDDRNNSVVMQNICDTNLLYKALTTNKRRYIKRILRDLTNEEKKYY